MIDLDDATYAAFYTAANMRAKQDPAGNSLHWATLGQRPLTAFEVNQLAVFVRQNPGAPAEALWRYASAGQLHEEPADRFATASDADRLPYAVFQAVLAVVDDVVADLIVRGLQRQAIVPDRKVNLFDPAGTLLERNGSMLAPADFLKPRAATGHPATDRAQLDLARGRILAHIAGRSARAG